MQKCYTMQMPTQKKRINITIDDATYAAIERLADEREESISRTSLRLIEESVWQIRETAEEVVDAEALLEAARKPLAWAIWLIGISWAAESTGGEAARAEIFENNDFLIEALAD